MHFIFFFLVLIVYIGACYYIAHRLCKVVSNKLARIGIYTATTFFTFGFFIQRILSDFVPEWANRIIYLAVTMWLVVILYTAVMLLIFGLARFIAKRKNGSVPDETISTWWRIISIVAIILVTGIINAYTPRLTHYTLHSDNMPAGDTLRIALVSDIHLGYAVRTSDAEKVKMMINAQHPDMCIIAGDVFDGDIRPVIDNNLGAALGDIKTPYGTFAVLGNHDFMSNADAVENYLKGLKIKVLRDSAVTICNNSFHMPPYIRIIGRDDITKEHMEGSRKPLEELDSDTCQVRIVIDHQPGKIDESVAINADLHVSGHTHAGQVWPMRAFTKMTYEHDYGYMRKGATDIIVTSGFGTWGPRLRLGNTPEIVIIELTN